MRAPFLRALGRNRQSTRKWSPPWEKKGIDLSAATPQYLSTDLAKDAHILITMGCGDECPLIPGVERDDWPLEDPKGKPAETVARIRDEIQKRVVELVHERKWG